MIKLTERHLSLLLKITAVVNMGSALAALTLPQLNVQLLYGTTQPLSELTLSYHNLFWSTVLCMGIGYLIAARAPAQQSALITCGALGKLSVALIWSELLWEGNAAPLLLGAIVFDGIFGLMFLMYVWSQKTDRVSE